MVAKRHLCVYIYDTTLRSQNAEQLREDGLALPYLVTLKGDPERDNRK